MITAQSLAEDRKLTILYWGRFTISDLQNSIRRMKIGRTHSLISSLNFKFHPEAEGDGVINLEFNYYGKFLDMGVGRGRKIEDLQTNRLVYQAIGQRNKSHKWLSKTAYTQISILKHILQEKYGEDAANLVRESIINKINLTM